MLGTSIENNEYAVGMFLNLAKYKMQIHMLQALVRY